MIIGIYLRRFKTYNHITYIPLTDEDKFCGLVGDNGIGKSSVLEALDCYFNDKDWNLNTVTKKSGTTQTPPYIVPIFILEKGKIPEDCKNQAELLNTIVLGYMKDATAKDDPLVTRLESLINNINIQDFYILPLGIDLKGNFSAAIFNKIITKTPKDDDGEETIDLKCFSQLQKTIKSTIDYIFIPREIDPDIFTQLETAEIQVLMGETLVEILDKIVTPTEVKKINKGLTEFIETLGKELKVYEYRTPTQRQQNLRKLDIHKLIIQAFFSPRKLNKLQPDQNWLEINSLSSGEKQKAILDVAHGFLSNHRESGENLIIAVDEPESSLHMSACFDQFDSLYQMSRDCMQVLFSSHWYGFLPTMDTGSTTMLSKDPKGNRNLDLINLDRYREQVKQLTSDSAGKLPHDVRLKSINDFVQSVITSIMRDDPYNWIICEGTSEKIYLNYYLKEFIDNKKLRIVPVGGAGEIKRFYNHISTSYEDFKKEIKGNIILLSDTDAQLVSYTAKEHDFLKCRRLLKTENEAEIKLVQMGSNHVSPATEIEDGLNGKLFFDILLSFKESYPEELNFLETITALENSSLSHQLECLPKDKLNLKEFFNKDNNKYLFAEKYINTISDEHSVPNWIEELKTWLK